MITLEIAEIPYETGELRFRCSRRLAPNNARWVREGLFQSFYKNGRKSSEGQYRDGLEQGEWVTFHKNGQLASRGCYVDGIETGDWEYWSEDGEAQAE